MQKLILRTGTSGLQGLKPAGLVFAAVTVAYLAAN